MSISSYSRDADRRVQAQVARNNQRLNDRYSGSSVAARQALESRERFLRDRALGR